MPFPAKFVIPWSKLELTNDVTTCLIKEQRVHVHIRKRINYWSVCVRRLEGDKVFCQKELVYPEWIKADDESAEVDLQSLFLDQTIDRDAPRELK